MGTKQLILKLVAKRPFIRSSDILRRKRMTRQALAQHFRELIDQGKLIKTGSTRGARYFSLSKAKSKRTALPWFDAFFRIRNLEEDQVFRRIDLKLRLKKRLPFLVFNIMQYAFTEMLNNAIEHSRAATVRTKFLFDGKNVRFEVIDHGVGAFENLKRKFKL